MAERVVVEFDARTGKVNRAFKELQGQTEQTQQKFGGLKKAAIGAAIAIGTTLAVGIWKAVNAASNLEETTGKFNTVFKGVSGTAKKMEKDLVTAYNLSTEEARRHLAAVQDLFVPLGFARDKAADFSGAVVKLAADLGSFNNMPTDRVLADIKSALVGNFETMKKYSVVLNQTVIKQHAMNKGLWDGKGALDAATRAQVAYELIVKGSGDAIGDVARTSESFANQMRKLKAAISDTVAVIGQLLLPAATKIVKIIGNIVTKLRDWIIEQRKLNDMSFKASQMSLKEIDLRLKEIRRSLAFNKKKLEEWNHAAGSSFALRKKIHKLEEELAAMQKKRAEIMKEQVQAAQEQTDEYEEQVESITTQKDAFLDISGSMESIGTRYAAFAVAIAGVTEELNDQNNAWEKMLEKISEISSKIGGIFGAAGGAFGGQLGSVLSAIGNIVQGFASGGAIGGIIAIISNLINLMGEGLTPIIEELAPWIDTLFEQLVVLGMQIGRILAPHIKILITALIVVNAMLEIFLPLIIALQAPLEVLADLTIHIINPLREMNRHMKNFTQHIYNLHDAISVALGGGTGPSGQSAPEWWPFQHGGQFTVPPGFPNDSYKVPLALTSGEEVTIKPRGRSSHEIIVNINNPMGNDIPDLVAEGIDKALYSRKERGLSYSV